MPKAAAGTRSGALLFPMPSVLDFVGSELCVQSCVKSYLTNLPGIFLGHINIVLRDTSSNQLLKKLRVLLFQFRNICF